MADGSIEHLLTVEAADCSRDELFDRLIELDQLVSRAQARRERFLAAVHDPSDPKQWAREEVACALRWSIGYTEARPAQATQLVTKLPLVLQLHEAGALSDAHARAAAEAGYGLTPEVVAAVEQRVIGRAAEQTVTQFRASLRRAVARLDTRRAEERHAEAKAARLVRLSPLPDGMSGIWSVHSAVDAAAMFARLTEIARRAGQNTATTGGPDEGIDARRADAGARPDPRRSATCITEARTARQARVQVLVPQATAAGYSDAPGELVGYGPIPASQCRALLADPSSRVEQVAVDDARQVLPTGLVECPTRRVPTASQARWVTARFPTCRLYAPGWAVRRDADGTFHWRTPHGRVYRTPPDELPTADP